MLPWAAKGTTPAAPAGAMPVTKSTAATENSRTPVAVQARPTLNWDFASLLPAAFRGEDIRAPTSVRGGVGNIPARRPKEIIAPRAGLLPPSLPGLTPYQGPAGKLRGPPLAAGPRPPRASLRRLDAAWWGPCRCQAEADMRGPRLRVKIGLDLMPERRGGALIAATPHPAAMAALCGPGSVGAHRRRPLCGADGMARAVTCPAAQGRLLVAPARRAGGEVGAKRTDAAQRRLDGAPRHCRSRRG